VRECNSGDASPVEPFLQANKTVVADDEMIDQFDVQLLACLHQLLCDGDILVRGGWIATGMVVADNNAGAIAQDGGAVDLRCTQYRAIDRSLVARDILDDLVLRIEG
jgi:hypothetical protein